MTNKFSKYNRSEENGERGIEKRSKKVKGTELKEMG